MRSAFPYARRNPIGPTLVPGCSRQSAAHRLRSSSAGLGADGALSPKAEFALHHLIGNLALLGTAGHGTATHGGKEP